MDAAGDAAAAGPGAGAAGLLGPAGARKRAAEPTMMMSAQLKDGLTTKVEKVVRRDTRSVELSFAAARTRGASLLHAAPLPNPSAVVLRVLGRVPPPSVGPGALRRLPRLGPRLRCAFVRQPWLARHAACTRSRALGGGCRRIAYLLTATPCPSPPLPPRHCRSWRPCAKQATLR